jgi:hypothetical protein
MLNFKFEKVSRNPALKTPKVETFTNLEIRIAEFINTCCFSDEKF